MKSNYIHCLYQTLIFVFLFLNVICSSIIGFNVGIFNYAYISEMPDFLIYFVYYFGFSLCFFSMFSFWYFYAYFGDFCKYCKLKYVHHQRKKVLKYFSYLESEMFVKPCCVKCYSKKIKKK